MADWKVLPDSIYDIYPNVVVHEVRCPICNFRETYSGDTPPDKCYICESPLNMPKYDKEVI